jgi:hypothetical protein
VECDDLSSLSFSVDRVLRKKATTSYRIPKVVALDRVLMPASAGQLSATSFSWWWWDINTDIGAGFSRASRP